MQEKGEKEKESSKMVGEASIECGVAMVSRLLQIIGLFAKYTSLL